MKIDLNKVNEVKNPKSESQKKVLNLINKMSSSSIKTEEEMLDVINNEDLSTEELYVFGINMGRLAERQKPQKENLLKNAMLKTEGSMAALEAVKNIIPEKYEEIKNETIKLIRLGDTMKGVQGEC